MEPRQFMLSVTGIIVSGLTGGLAGALLSHLLTTKRDKVSRRNDFQNTISVILAELQDTEDDVSVFFKSSKRTVSVECAKIGRNISCCRRDRFKSARAAYCDIYQQDAQAGMQRHGHKLQDMFDPKAEHPAPLKDDRSIKQRMIDALQELIDCAN